MVISVSVVLRLLGFGLTLPPPILHDSIGPCRQTVAVLILSFLSLCLSLPSRIMTKPPPVLPPYPRHRLRLPFPCLTPSTPAPAVTVAVLGHVPCLLGPLTECQVPCSVLTFPARLSLCSHAFLMPLGALPSDTHERLPCTALLYGLNSQEGTEEELSTLIL